MKFENCEINSQPLVSIIMGAYNCENTIGQCIDSILNQTYQNWEFIICDDCSTDNTYKIIEQYHNPKIRLIKNDTNLRLAASLNHALQYADGKYVARMDADDEALPERLEMQVNFLEKNEEYSCVGSSVIVFDDDGDKYVRYVKQIPTMDDLLKGTPFAHPTILFRKDVLIKLDGYTADKNTIRSEDMDLWFKFFSKGYAGYNLENPLYRYREGAEDFKKRSLYAGVMTTRAFLNACKECNIPIHKRIWGIKPIIAALIPNKIMMFYHNVIR